MKAAPKDDDLDLDMLRTVAKAEASRSMPTAPEKLEQWLYRQVQIDRTRSTQLIQAPVWHSWFDFLNPMPSVSRRNSLQMGIAGVVGGALLGAGSVAWLTRRPSSQQESIPRWVDAIAQYQSLYARETLTGSVQNSAQAQAILQAFAQAAHLPAFLVPDLSSHGLSFQRAQRLNFEKIPLLQMVYLPPEGTPVALCVMPSKLLKMEELASGSQALKASVHGMSSLYWQRDELAWVIVANWPDERLQSVVNGLQRQV